MAISDDVDPPGPVGVVVTDAEVFLVASGKDGARVTRVAGHEILTAAEVEPDAVSLRIARPDGADRKIVLDFRYFGVTDDTVAKLLGQFPASELPV
jgi:hypothetical protein